jgi:hypothetical protein
MEAISPPLKMASKIWSLKLSSVENVISEEYDERPSILEGK